MALRESTVDVSFNCDFSEVDRLDSLVDNLIADVTGSLGDAELGVVDLSDEFGDLSRSAIRDIDRIGRELDGLGSGNPIQPLEDDVNGLGQETQQTRKKVSELGREFADALGGIAEKEVDNLTNSVSGLGDALGTALGVAGIGLGAGAIISSTNDIQVAMNGLQAQTGITGKELENMGESMENLYLDNMGEDFGDIANAMANVNQVLGLTGDELENATQKALLMRDTFDFDVSESMRAVNSLMDNFGVSADEAYSMIAQGAQNGLNQNDDLLDTINEYSVQFKKLGFSSEDMFNSLANGVESGTWSVDKLGDAVKEFSIRAIDGSKTTIEGFEAIGLDAKKMMGTFAKGGDSANKAFQDVVKGLVAIEDPVKRDTAGVNLFGTMWEDLGVKGVSALANLDGGISKSTESLDAINEVKYDDAGSALASLGRTINVALADEVGGAVEDVKGYITDFTAGIKGAEGSTETTFGKIGNKVAEVGRGISDTVKFMIDNWNMIAPALMVVIGLIGTVKGAILAYNAVCAIQKGIQIASTVASYAMATAKGVEVASTVAATGAQLGLNTALLACPITWIILAIMAVIAVIILVIAYFDEIKAGLTKLWNYLVSVFTPVGEWIKSNVIDPIVNFFTGLWNTIVNFFSMIGSAIASFFMPIITAVSTFFTTIYNFIVGVVTWVYTYIITPIIQIYAKLFEILFTLAQVGIGYIKSFIMTIVNWVNTNVVQPILTIVGVIAGWINTNVVQPVITFFMGMWNRIKAIFSTVGSFFRNAFMTAFNAVKSVFSGLTTFFSGLWAKIKGIFTKIGSAVGEAIGGNFKSAINGAISFVSGVINGFIRAVNRAVSIVNEIPGVEIGKLKEISIPRLATGGIVDDSTLANIGEAGTEAVVPLENNLGWLDKMANMIVGAMYKQSAYTPSSSSTVNNSNTSKSIVVEKGAVVINVEGGKDGDSTANKVRDKIEEFFSDLRDDNRPVFEY